MLLTCFSPPPGLWLIFFLEPTFACAFSRKSSFCVSIWKESKTKTISLLCNFKNANIYSSKCNKNMRIMFSYLRIHNDGSVKLHKQWIYIYFTLSTYQYSTFTGNDGGSSPLFNLQNVTHASQHIHNSTQKFVFQTSIKNSIQQLTY